MGVYRSKVDIWLAVVVFTPLFIVLFIDAGKGDYESFYFLLPVIALIVSLYWQIKYKIEEGYLKVTAGIFGTAKVPVSEIKSVGKTYNPLSAPALSINRLEVKYGKFNYLLISPHNRDAFINELKAINPAIDIKL